MYGDNIMINLLNFEYANNITNLKTDYYQATFMFEISFKQQRSIKIPKA